MALVVGVAPVDLRFGSVLLIGLGCCTSKANRAQKGD